MPVTPARVAATYPHDPAAFTQGLLFHAGRLYESTGQYGASQLREVALDTGAVRRRRALDDSLFGEGLARYRNRLYQLTWHAGIVRVVDIDSFEPVKRLRYNGEGWGLTSCGDQLVMSNGSSVLSFRHPETFARERSLTVTENGRPVDRLNELETIHGMIWANQWMQDRILIIDPRNGHVVHVLDAHALADRQPARADVLNGIAYDARTDAVYITGKYWPTLYRLANDPALGASGRTGCE